MDTNILVQDNECEGKFVAIKSLVDRTVVACGNDPRQVKKQAQKEGYENTIVTFMPNKNMSFCF